MFRALVLVSALALAVGLGCSGGGGPSLEDCRALFGAVKEMQDEGRTQAEIAMQIEAIGWPADEFNAFVVVCIDAYGGEKLRGG